MPAIDAIGLTQRLIEFDTINPPGNEAGLAAYLDGILSSNGFVTQRHAFSSTRESLIAIRGNSDAPVICFTGHLDTVPLGNLPWRFPAHAGEIHDGKLYGRGASDMKAGVAAMVAAAAALPASSGEGVGIVFVFTAGEETGCEGAAHLAAIRALPQHVAAVVVGEPTSNQPRIGHKGALWVRAESDGHSAHGSMPELGVNAIHRSAAIIMKLNEFGFNTPPHEGLGSPTLNVGRIEGGTTVNLVPDYSALDIDIRTVPGLRHDAVLVQLASYLGADLDRLTTLVDLPSVWTTPNDPWLRHVVGRLGVQLDDLSPKGLPFFTDASVLKPHFGNPPTLILGPGETHMAHKTDEYCVVERILEAVDLYRLIIEDWQEAGAAVAAGNRSGF